jgi:hypothetical protein
MGSYPPAPKTWGLVPAWREPPLVQRVENAVDDFRVVVAVAELGDGKELAFVVETVINLPAEQAFPTLGSV